MLIDEYLERIGLIDRPTPDIAGLTLLHEYHVFSVPFENLDIWYKKQFDLQIENVFTKVVRSRRGGFCYELNSLFSCLLTELGFHNRIIASRIVEDSGLLGPEYDHMSVLVEIGSTMYLADVGYGDLFLRPLEIRHGIQSDGRSSFRIERTGDGDYLLSMAPANEGFKKKYRFNLDDACVSDFAGICLEKQTSPDSYFVKNLVCSLPTNAGRVTLFNEKLIEKTAADKIEATVGSDAELKEILRRRFNIVLP